MNLIFQTASDFVLENMKQIISILLLFLFGKIVLLRFVKKIVKISSRDEKNSLKQRKQARQAKTIGQVVITTGNVAIYTTMVFMVLDLFNVNLGPVLTGAGIVGLAVGFGSQALVRDFVSGLFIIMEQQYGIGDHIQIGDVEGEVVKVSMRSTVLKDKEGSRVYLANGTITKVINSTQSGNVSSSASSPKT